jgi:hypothetical protein
VDAQGNLQVLSRLDWRRQYRTRGDDRELAILNAFELATVDRTRTCTLSLNLSLADEELTPEQAREFFGSAVAAGLLPEGADARAMRRVGASALTPGRLDVGLSLTRAQLLRLLRITAPEGTLAEQPDLDPEWLLGVAARNLGDIVTAQPHDRRQLRLIASLQRDLPDFGIDLGADLRGAIERLTRRGYAAAEGAFETLFGDDFVAKRNAAAALSWVLARRLAVTGCHAECVGREENAQDGLVDVLRLMREIYFSHDRGWAPGDYRERQHRIGEALKRWSYWGHAWRWWLLNDERIRPLTLALFRTVADLAQGEDAASPLRLTASLTQRGPEGNRFVLLA